MPPKPPIALTIAGFDPSGGAGITADLAVYAVFGLFGTSAITTRTAQNTLGVAAREDSSREHLQLVLDTLDADLPPAGVKIGALGNASLAETAANWLADRKKNIPVVWDPVLVSSSGTPLFDLDGLDALHSTFIPQVGWAKPNWAELALLTSLPVTSLDDARAAGNTLTTRHPGLGLLITAGDQPHPIDLLFTPGGTWQEFPGETIQSRNTHGTGCAFSSAFLAQLILGSPPPQAFSTAKQYVAQAILQAPNLGSGKGPLNLYWPLRPPDAVKPQTSLTPSFDGK